MENTNYHALLHVLLFVAFLMVIASSTGKKDE